MQRQGACALLPPKVGRLQPEAMTKLHIGLLPLILVVLVACAGTPVDRGATVHFNYHEDALGEQYRYSADEVSGTWSFNQQAEFVLRFEGGGVTYDGTRLESGCYSDQAQRGDVIEADGATLFELHSPASDDDCAAIS